MERVRLAERPIMRLLLLGFGLWLLVRLLEQVVWALVVILLAVILAAAIMPVVRLLRRAALPPRGWRLPRAVAALAVYIMATLALSIIGYAVGRSFVADLVALLTNLPDIAVAASQRA